MIQVDEGRFLGVMSSEGGVGEVVEGGIKQEERRRASHLEPGLKKTKQT